MNGVLNASVSAGSSHLGASVTCRPQRISPSAAWADGASARTAAMRSSPARAAGRGAGRFMGVASEDRERVRGRAGGAHQAERRRGEQELVAAFLGRKIIKQTPPPVLFGM